MKVKKREIVLFLNELLLGLTFPLLAESWVGVFCKPPQKLIVGALLLVFVTAFIIKMFIDDLYHYYKNTRSKFCEVIWSIISKLLLGIFIILCGHDNFTYCYLVLFVFFAVSSLMVPDRKFFSENMAFTLLFMALMLIAIIKSITVSEFFIIYLISLLLINIVLSIFIKDSIKRFKMIWRL